MILGQALPITVMRSLYLKMKGLEKMNPKMPRLPDAFVNPHCLLLLPMRQDLPSIAFKRAAYSSLHMYLSD